MKVKSNKSSSKSSIKSNSIPSPTSDMSQKPRYTVEEISNGFIIEKSHYDKTGKYCCVKTYSKTNPLDGEIDEKE